MGFGITSAAVFLTSPFQSGFLPPYPPLAANGLKCFSNCGSHTSYNPLVTQIARHGPWCMTAQKNAPGHSVALIEKQREISPMHEHDAMHTCNECAVSAQSKLEQQ